QWRGIPRGEGALAGTPVERGLELREFLHRAVGAHVVVDLQALVFADHEITEKSPRPGLAGVHMAEIRERILVGARDLPGLGHLLAVFAHRKARARLEHAGHHRFEMARAQAEEWLDAPPTPARPIRAPKTRVRCADLYGTRV